MFKFIQGAYKNSNKYNPCILLYTSLLEVYKLTIIFFLIHQQFFLAICVRNTFISKGHIQSVRITCQIMTKKNIIWYEITVPRFKLYLQTVVILESDRSLSGTPLPGLPLSGIPITRPPLSESPLSGMPLLE